MRPLILLIGVFGFAYVLWAWINGIRGSEVGVIAVIAYDLYSFGRIFIHPGSAWPELAVYGLVVAFFLLVFGVMIMVGLFGRRTGGKA